MSDLPPYREVPEGKQVNGFTGELEDKAPLSLNPDPADQRILSNNPVDKPLAELNDLHTKGLINLDGTPAEEATPEEEPQVEEVVPVEEPAQEEGTDDVPVQTSSDDSDTEDTTDGTPKSV